MAKILVTNTKGGVGKSTIAQQVLVPYLYEKSGKPVRLVEIDELNFDSSVFKKSKIMKIVPLKLNQLSELAGSLTEDNLVIDTGGNLTGDKALNFLNESGLLSLIDLVVIPVADGEQDSVNAVDTMNRVKKFNSGVEIVFALNRVRNIESKRDISMQFPAWSGFWETSGYMPKDAKEFYVPDSIAIKHSRRFGITVYEISKQNIDDFKKKLLEAGNKKDENRIKAISDRIYLINKSKDFINTVFNQVQPFLEKK